MKILFVCLFICVSAVKGWGRGDLEKYGPFQTLLRTVKCDHDRTLNLDVGGVDVYFYDFTKTGFQVFPINDAAKGILAIPNLDKDRKFIVFVGGYKSHINKNTEQRVRETFQNVPNTYLIILDHSDYTNDKQGYKASYENSVQYVHYIGKALGLMLTGLRNGGVPAKQIHAIGHSLGAQMLAHTGETFTNNTGDKIWRITGLDPAGPCFSNSLIHEQLRSGVAEYVEVYHCNAGGLGTTSVLGDVDFFVNRKGQSQPDCHTPLIPGVFDSSKAAKCNHKACILIWMVTVAHPDWFVARRCDEYRSFKDGECSLNDMTKPGYWNPGNATGVYYFLTAGHEIH